jgi:type VI secretion system protein ImpE
MSQAKTLFERGQLNEAIDELTREVKSNPGNTELRIFLFELLCFAGDWDRAERQLDVVGHQSTQAKVGVEVYRNNIRAERDRRKLFSDGVSPHFLLEPPSYVDLLLTAVKVLNVDGGNQTRSTLDLVEEQRPPLTGKINEVQFEDFQDCDELTGPVLEIFVKDQYTWLPFEQIKQMEIAKPQNLRDLLWANARIETSDGTMAEVFLPALYAGSSEHPDDQVRLGRRTEWKQYRDDLILGAGSRLLLVDDEENQIFDTGTIVFNPQITQISQI